MVENGDGEWGLCTRSFLIGEYLTYDIYIFDRLYCNFTNVCGGLSQKKIIFWVD